MSHIVLPHALSVVFIASTALAQENPTDADKDFLVRAITNNVMTVKMAEIGAKEASHGDVKAFATHLVREHQLLNDKLVHATGELKVGVIAGFEKDRRDMLDRLEKAKGPAFNHVFLKAIVDHHQKTIESYESQVRSGQHPKLKSYVQESLPMLREHHKKAAQLLEQNKVR